MNPEKGKSTDRRTFLKYLIGIISAGIAAALGIPIIGYVISPTLKKGQDQWTQIGIAGKFEADIPQEVTFRTLKKDSWIQRFTDRSVWVVAKGGDKFDVFSPSCTHLGCAYSWFEEEGEFKCPCHRSVFDISGNVLEGPAPRPLDRYETKVQDGRLLIGTLIKGVA